MASGSQKRFTTVHDRAALRVHPDGTRVATRESRYATQDLRGNYTAVNAGRTGNVKKRKRPTLSDDGSELMENFNLETDEYQPSESQPSSTDSCAGEVEESEREDKKGQRRKKDPRTIKRTQFYQDLDFILDDKDRETVPASNNLSLPSSDLLKCLHFFAAKYYFDKGQLIDASRTARQKKKASIPADTEAGSRSSSRSMAGSVSGEESDHSCTDVASIPPSTLQTPQQKGRQGADLIKDMYRVFDGSALVAIGVLAHEHIERLLQQDGGVLVQGNLEQEQGLEDELEEQ